MSYSITISGHKDGLTADEARDFERGILDEARRFAGGLEGVTTATASTTETGYVNLLPAS